MASYEGDNFAIASKSNTRKRKIEIKKVEEINKLHVTFSKRKVGLFNKVTELSILCQAKIALIISSPNDKLFVCGYPNPDTIFRHFLAGEKPQAVAEGNQQQEEEIAETLRLRYEEIQEELKEEKKKLQEVMEAHKSNSCSPSWWNFPIEGMNLEALEQFKTSIEHLKLNLVTTMEEKSIDSLLPLPIGVLPPLSNYSSDYFGQEVHDWNSGASGSFGVPSFDHYYIN